ncbi:MAG: hypothetical protein M3437_10505 [Chloroflexota bacterium]|nr:hypothetical protein [Chloroflexota bacterium]MDQ5866619.1 hypothetical protein [Chloroflexota bacterium]
MTSASRAEDAAASVTAAPSEAPEQTGPVEHAVATPTRSASYLSLLLFYLPLGFSGIMMTLDLPILNAVLNRFPNANTSVAALSVAFSLALVYEASHISMIDLSTALSSDQRTFRMLQRFYVIMAGVLLVFASIIAFSPLYYLIVRDVMNIPPEVANAARPAVWAFLLWPVPIGWRRLCQGALIKHGHPKPVGAGGIVRLAALIVALVFFGWLGTMLPIEPAAIGVLAMLVSVTAEALAVQGWTSRLVKTMPEATPGKPPPTWADIRRFFFPLSGTAIMGTLVQPTMRAGIASAAVAWAATPNSETVAVAVAAYQTAWSMAFLAFGPTLSMTQASIAWSGSPDPSVRERGPWVIMGVGLGLGALMALFAFTPLSEWIFTSVIQSPPQTAHLAAEVARWLVPMPVLHSASFMLRGRLIAMHRPQAVRRAQLIDLLSVIIIIQLAVSSFSPLSGVLRGASAAPVAAIAYNLMLCVDIGILLLSLRGRSRAAG